MNKKAMLAVISIVIMVLSLIFSVNNVNDVVLGDVLFEKLGLKAWSKGDSGIHYIAVVAIIIFIIGAIGFMRYRNNLPKQTRRILPLFVVMSAIIYPSWYSSIYAFVRSNASGLHSIDYVKKESTFKYDIKNNDKYTFIDAKLVLRVYGNEDKQFYIKLLPQKRVIGASFIEKSMYALDTTSNRIKKFHVSPKANKKINIFTRFKVKLKKDMSGSSGECTGLKIMIYNDKSKVKFIH